MISPKMVKRAEVMKKRHMPKRINMSTHKTGKMT